MEIPIYKFVRVADEVVAVRYSGDPDEARLLIANGWLDGADQGFNRDNEGNDVLRGLIGDVVVYPYDIIAFHEDWTLETFEMPVFMAKYDDRADVAVLTDGAEDTPEVDLIATIPDGTNPDAVPLENPTPTEQRFGGTDTPPDPAVDPEIAALLNPPTEESVDSAGDDSQPDPQAVGGEGVEAGSGTSDQESGDSVLSETESETDSASAATPEATTP